MSRLRGLQQFRCQDQNSYQRLAYLLAQFGWFHLEVALDANFHSEYYGTTAGRGLAFAIELLNRRGLNSTSVQGLFHHNMEELLLHLGTAYLRDVWCHVAEVNTLSVLRNKSLGELHTLAVRIVDEYASTDAIQQHQMKPKDEQDGVLVQSFQFNRDFLDYLDVHMAIKSGDVGALEDQLPRLFFRFLGGRNVNYSNEVLSLMHSMTHEWTAELKYVHLLHSYCDC